MIARFLAITVFSALAGLSPALAQARFEVASIRPTWPGAPKYGATVFRGDRFDAESTTVGDLLDMVNGWQLFRVVGGPPWMTTDRFEIHGRAGVAIPAEQQGEAIMALLAERFNLTVHKETRSIPAMVLLAPKKPGGLKATAAGEQYAMRFNERNEPTFTAESIVGFTNYLSQMWHLPVVDQTGLEGTFDFSINPGTVIPEPRDTWGDRVREAVIAAGCKVEERKAAVEVTVVDRCERPSEN